MEVYFIQIDDDGPIKIGRAKNSENRLRCLQTAHHRELNILYVEENPKGGAKEYEKVLHEKFKEYRMRGEWFRPSQEILEYVGKAPLSWRKIIIFDDELKFLYEDALIAEPTEDDLRRACPKNGIWYREFKPRMYRHVGFGRKHPPKELQSSDAYDICYHKISEAIPCPQKCKYFGASGCP